MGEAKKVAGRLLKALMAPFAFNGRDVTLSPSIGIALSATGYHYPEDALRDADAALYRAKSLGKSRCEVFDTAILEYAQNRQSLEQDLHGALSRNEFLVFYQPIVSLAANRVEGLEALVRWKHPSRGMISPADFIPVAEKTGIIESLGRWVLQQACRQLKSWKDNPLVSKDLWISVNLSGAQFTKPSLAKEIREILLETGLDASGLILELTEGIAVENPEAARNLLMQLRVMGARIAIDDFGTGYSSLAHLRRFPLDFLKIDQSFVKSIEKKADAREIIRTIRTLAHQLGLRIIVEGIENAGQLDLIRSMGCEYGQGFLFSKAVSSEQIEPFLLDGFAFADDEVPAKAGADGSSTETETSGEYSPGAAVSAPDPQLCRKPTGTFKRTWVLAAITVLILLFMGGMLARLDRYTSPPVAHTSPPDHPVAAKARVESAPSPGIAETPSAKEEPKTTVAAPAAVKAKMSPAAYSYRVVHAHRLGSCRGTLKVTRSAISYAAENGNDDFAFKHAQCSCELEGDKLTIKAESKTFRFKSADAKTTEQNRADLQKIYTSISRFHPEKTQEDK